MQQIAEALETESKKNTMSQETDLLDRITVRPDVFGGKPIIRDMRIAVEHVLANLAAGGTVEDILREYPFLEPEDIQACLLFAHRSLAGEHVHDRVAVRSDEALLALARKERRVLITEDKDFGELVLLHGTGG